MDKKKLILGGIILFVLILIGLGIFLLVNKPGDTGSDTGNTGGVVDPTGSSNDGGSSGDSDSGSSNAPSVTLKYDGLWEPEAVMEPLIEEYERANPQVQVEYVQKSFTKYEENAYSRLVEGSSTGQPVPDILKIHNTWLPKYEDYLTPLPSSIMTKDEYSSTFYPTIVEDFTGSDGDIYAIPLSIDGLAVFYNKELLLEAGYTEPPADWDSFIECAKELTKEDDSGNIEQAGVAMGTGKNIKHAPGILNLLMLQNQAEPYNPATGQVTLSSSEAENAMQFYTDFANVHNTWSPDFTWDLDKFYSGTLAMMFAPSWRAFDIVQNAPQLEFGIGKVPQLANNPPVGYAMYWGEVVPADSENPEEAWKFIKFLSEKEQMKSFYNEGSQIRTFGQPYSRKDIADELSDNPYVGSILEMAPYMQSWKMTEQTYVEDTLRESIEEARDGNISSALSTAESDINSKLNPTSSE